MRWVCHSHDLIQSRTAHTKPHISIFWNFQDQWLCSGARIFLFLDKQKKPNGDAGIDSHIVKSINLRGPTYDLSFRYLFCIVVSRRRKNKNIFFVGFNVNLRVSQVMWRVFETENEHVNSNNWSNILDREMIRISWIANSFCPFSFCRHQLSVSVPETIYVMVAKWFLGARNSANSFQWHFMYNSLLVLSLFVCCRAHIRWFDVKYF